MNPRGWLNIDKIQCARTVSGWERRADEVYNVPILFQKSLIVILFDHLFIQIRKMSTVHSVNDFWLFFAEVNVIFFDHRTISISSRVPLKCGKIISWSHRLMSYKVILVPCFEPYDTFRQRGIFFSDLLRFYPNKGEKINDTEIKEM